MNGTVVPQDTRSRLVEELDRLHVPPRDHLDLIAWLCGMDSVPSLSVLSVGECQHALERISNAVNPAGLLSAWRAARAAAEMTGEDWLMYGP